ADPDAQALVPGSGMVLPRSVEDMLWSAFNHNWAGVFVLAAGLLAIGDRFGLRWCRNWPLVFLGLAAFIFVRADEASWPLGSGGFFESFRDPEVAQHRAAVPLVITLGLFEWTVRTERIHRQSVALVFPLMCVMGGLLLLTHSHAIDNVKEQLLIEISHNV